MPRDLTRERHAAHYICTSDACLQGRRACPVPTACEVSESPLSWSDVLLAVGIVAALAGFVLCGPMFRGWL